MQLRPSLLQLPLAGVVLSAAALGQQTLRASATAAGVQANGHSSRPSITDDGSLVAFYSEGDNLVPGDTNLVSDIFVWERATGAVTRVSVSSAGVQGNAKSSRPSIAGGGRYVGFYSDADNLVPGDTNLTRDIFVHDLQTSTTVRVSVSSAGVQGSAGAGLGESSRPSLSPDGRFVAFKSAADNLVAGDINLETDAFLHDRDTDADGIYDEPGAISTIRVSVSTAGIQGNRKSSIPVVSADGRFVAFRSTATNLVPGDTNLVRDVFVRDVLLGTTTRVSVNTAGAQGNLESSRPAISNDGRFVTFYSQASNLVPGDTNLHSFIDIFGQPQTEPAEDCFVRDRDTDGDGIFDEVGAVKTVRVSVTSAGGQANDRSEDPDISGDGRYVTYWSESTNLVPGDTNGVIDAFLHDRDTDEDGVYDEPGAIDTKRVSVSTAGVQGNGESKRQVISGDGRFVAFRSDATNLVTPDVNLAGDVFVRDECAACNVVGTPFCPGDGTGAACPCGNPSVPGADEGCRNQTGVGAALTGVGSTSVAADDLVLLVCQMQPNQFGLVFMGPSGFGGVPFGDGLRCIGPPFYRYLVSQATGAGCFSVGPGNVAYSQTAFTAGGHIQAGSTFFFQGWYRDPAGPCGSSFNLTNGLEVGFTP